MVTYLRCMCWRLLLAGVVVSHCGVVLGYESDQITYRLTEVEDSLALMDARVNEALDKVATEWKGPPNNVRAAIKVYDELGGWYWVDRIETWAARNEAIDRYPQTRYHNVYAGMPIWVTRVNFLFGVGRSYRINDVMVGSDKLGHFISQGLKYYKRLERGWPMARMLSHGAALERWWFGQLTTGVYANADLVANYEGMRFYQSLFEDDVIDGKAAIFAWEDGKLVRRRDFTWADHINDYWDEALNPSFLIPSLDRRIRKQIEMQCPAFRRDPGHFVTTEDEALWKKYEFVGLKDARQNRFDRVCAGVPAQ